MINTNKEIDVYVIGFPKSGNTWLTRLLSDALNSNIYTPPNDPVTGAENSQEKNGRYIIYKKHTEGIKRQFLNAKKIYILRDPRAVFVSAFFHNYRHINNKLIKNSFFHRSLFNLEINNLNMAWDNTISAYKNWLKVRLSGNFEKFDRVGNWSEHVDYFTNFEDVHVVVYEELLKNTQKELEIMQHKFSFDYAGNIEDLVDKNSFKKKKEEYLEKGDIRNANFLRAGTKDSWKELLNENQEKKIIERHSKVMKKFNLI